MTSPQVSLAAALLVLAFASPAQADRVDDWFHELKHDGVDYTVFGTICEHLAVKQLQAEYPADEYRVTSGIVYKDSGRTLGELDVIVFRRSDDEAVVIAEVKCWRNLSSARRKANEQLSRFTGHMARQTPIQMHDVDDRSVAYEPCQFDEQPETLKISQKGGEQYGFDRALDLTLPQVKDLRIRLMSCQSRGDCNQAP